MKLRIDTSDSENITVEVGSTKILASSREKKSQMLLQSIKEAIDKEKVSLSDLTQIEVNTGPGSFTGLRMGVSVANALGWSRNIPVNGKDVGKDGPVEPQY